jgi:hypothetical protein
MGKTNIKIGIVLFNKINIDQSKQTNIQTRENEIGVQFIKKEYERLTKKLKKSVRLYDLIFPNKKLLKNVMPKDLTIVWDHGNTVKEVNDTVTAGIPGLHFYVTDGGDLVGIVRRTKNT